jgi:hypothetical protein
MNKVIAFAACALTLAGAGSAFALNPQPLPPIVRSPTGIVSAPKIVTKTSSTPSGSRPRPKTPANHHKS